MRGWQHPTEQPLLLFARCLELIGTVLVGLIAFGPGVGAIVLWVHFKGDIDALMIALLVTLGFGLGYLPAKAIEEWWHRIKLTVIVPEADIEETLHIVQRICLRLNEDLQPFIRSSLQLPGLPGLGIVPFETEKGYLGFSVWGSVHGRPWVEHLLRRWIEELCERRSITVRIK